MTIWTVSGLGSGLGSGFEWGVFGGVLVITYLILIIFGIAYNALIAWLERRGYIEGYISLSVIAGVLVTLGLLLIPQMILSIFLPVNLPAWGWGLVTLGGFGASGTPMMIGSISRYLIIRASGINSIKHEAGIRAGIRHEAGL